TSFTFLFIAPPTSEIYTLSLHDALPIWIDWRRRFGSRHLRKFRNFPLGNLPFACQGNVGEFGWWNRGPLGNLWLCDYWLDWCSRSEEHTSELQSLRHLVCRLLLEKKKK